jgi:hypothetical protein
VTSKSLAPRRASLVVVSATILVLAYAGPASADIPVGWSDPPPVPVLRNLLIFIGIPVLITLFIFAFVYLPSVVRGESVAPAGAHTDDQWFGGRRDTAALESASTSSSSTDGEAPADTGGAGGTW